MISFFKNRSSKSKKLEHERLATTAHYNEMMIFLLLISFLIIGIVANFVSTYYDAVRAKQSVTNTSAVTDQTATSTTKPPNEESQSMLK